MGHLVVTPPATPASTASQLPSTARPPAPSDTVSMRVEHRGGDKFAIGIRGHEVLVDQPEAAGGEDTAPTPTELFVASLASCVAFYARRYLRRHHLDEEGLVVEASFRMGDKPARVAAVEIQVVPPPSLPPGRRDGLIAVARHCTVHNSLELTPEVSVELV